MSSKKNTNLIAKVTLTENFREEINNSMEDELREASRKWNVELSKEQKQAILEHSWNQLNLKVKESYGAAWVFDNQIEVIILNANESSRMSIPSKASERSKLFVIRPKQHWLIDTEKSSDAISISSLHLFIEKEIHEWARTAVFYGVASFQ